jgi:Zn-dependent protease
VVAAWGGGVLSVIFSLALLAAMFVCVVLHELGHALTARTFGIATRDITLYPIGGVAGLENTGRQPFEELVIALAGPAVNLLIALLLLPAVVLAVKEGLLRAPDISLADGFLPLAALFAFYLMGLNLFMLLFNLLPAFPMDGGRVFRAGLEFFMGRLPATEIAANVGAVVALLVGLALSFGPLAAGGFNPIPLLIALFVIVVGRLELFMVRREARQATAGAGRAAEAPAAAPGVGFTGFRWDYHYRVWVRWQNGQPVEVYSAE